MSQRSYQDFWVAGSRFYVARDDDPNLGLIDMGIIQTVNPTIEPENIQLEDGDGGMLREVDETTIRMSEEWEVICHNLSPTSLAMFYMANAPELFVQPNGALIQDVPHKAVVGPGQFVKLRDANGAWLYNVDTVSIEPAGGGSPFVEGEDYEVTDKVRGLIKILPGGDIEHGEDIQITVTLNALAGKRLIKPHSSRGAIRAHAMVVYGRGNNARQTVREADVSITPSDSDIQIEEYSTLTFTARVLSTITEQDMPAGRLLQIAGDVPDSTPDES